MGELQSLIEKYQGIVDEDKKAGIISDEFDFLEDSNKWTFLLTLLDDKKTYDLVKVNIYKSIEIADFFEVDLVGIKDQILQNLKEEEDELVKQYGLMALTWNFNYFTDVLDYCIETIEDEEEDENVRHCAFGVITKSSNTEKVNSFRDRLLKTKDFIKYANTFFDEKENGK